MEVKKAIQQALSKALQKCGVPIEPQDVPLEFPGDPRHGDYASGVALKFAKQTGLSPLELATKIREGMGEIDGVEKIEVLPPGFINIRLSYQKRLELLRAASKNERWGANEDLSKQRVMVEYTDPNPFKEFHIGHLMSNAIGESISRLLKFSGAEVFAANYQGDVGPHVAKTVWAMKKANVGASVFVDAIGRFYVEGNKAYEEDPKAKEEIDEINQKIYDKSDAEINRLYDIGRSASLSHFDDIYKKLGTSFDHLFFESQTAPEGLEIVKAHPEVFVKSDGATVYKGEQDGLHTRVFVTSKDLPTYETKELGLAELKDETWKSDRSITVTGHEQADYFAVVLAAMKKVLPEIAPKIQHVSHGMMRLTTGKMSSRTGDVITGESLLNELTEQAKIRAAESRADDKEKLAEEVAVAAIKYQILKQSSGKDIIFDRERALSLEGDSGPYLQYAYARSVSLLEKARAAKPVEQMRADKDQDFQEVAGVTLISRKLLQFPDVVERAAKEIEPHLIATYLVELASAFSSWYATERIIVDDQILPDRIILIEGVNLTLKNGLWLLGIPAPEKM